MALDAYRATGSVMAASAASGVSARSINRHAADSDTEFGAAWQELREGFEVARLERYEIEAERRALDGVPRKITYAPDGETIESEERKYSDGLLTFLMKAADRQKYGDNVKVDQTTTTKADPDSVIDVQALSPEGRDHLRAILRDPGLVVDPSRN